MARILSDSRRRPVPLGEKIGGGAEGDVYRIANSHSRVAKIWHPHERTGERIAKINRMCQIDVSLNIRGDRVLAWPQDIVLENSRVVGYVMPIVLSNFTLFDCLTPFRISNNNVPITPDKIPLLASRIAGIFASLHGNKCYVGDVNPQNILIHTSSFVPILIDCDSFQVHNPKSPDSPHLSRVFTPEYRAPERVQSFSRIDASIDAFGLAVIVYQLLMGEHPFAGIDDVDLVEHVPSLTQRIANSRFAHAGEPLWRPRTPVVEQNWSAIPPPVRDVLAQALDYRQFDRNRPTAAQIRDIVKSHHGHLAAIQGRYVAARSYSSGVTGRVQQSESPRAPRVAESMQTPHNPTVSGSNHRNVQQNQTSSPNSKQSEEPEDQESWIAKHWCCILVIAIWILYGIVSIFSKV